MALLVGSVQRASSSIRFLLFFTDPTTVIASNSLPLSHGALMTNPRVMVAILTVVDTTVQSKVLVKCPSPKCHML